MAKSEQLGPFVLTQPTGVFPLGGDTLALGAFAAVRRGWRVCDLGCGGGALLLLLAGREPSLDLTGVELDPLSARAAQDNLHRNALSGRIIQGDLRQSGLPAGSFDLAVSNPPYFPTHAGPSAGSQRCEECCTLPQLCAAAGKLVRCGGRFALCHRPERLTDVFACLRDAGLEPKRLQLLCHSPYHPPSAVLVEAVRQGRPGLEILSCFTEKSR